jgi:surfeit locus 1 family protein
MTDSWEPRLEPAAGAAPARGFPVGLTIAAAVALAILLGLGVWQLRRLRWKEALLAHVAALQTARPQPLAGALAAAARGQDAAFARATVVCSGLAHAPFLEVYDLRDGQVGARLVSACAVATGPYGSILVDRGFAPDTAPARPRIDPADRAPVEVTGVLRRPERGNFMTPANRPGHWFLHDPAAMAAALGAARPAPLILFAETRINPELPALKPAALPPEIPNNHFQYALTWFGLAGALAGVYAAALFRRLRG